MPHVRVHSYSVAIPMLPHLFSCMGLFGILSTLSITLKDLQFNAEQIGLAIFVFTVSYRTARLPLAPLFDRVICKIGVLIGCGISVLGLLLFSVSTSLPMIIAALTVLGTGLSVNGLATKKLIAQLGDLHGNRAHILSIANIVANLAATIAPPIALWLVSRKYMLSLFMLLITFYALAGVLAALILMASDEAHTIQKNALSLSFYRKFLARPGLVPFLIVNAMGWFLNGQLFHTVALYASNTDEKKAYLGLLYTLSPIVVILLQLTVTRQTEHLVNKTKSAYAYLISASYVCYAIAFVLLFLFSGYGGLVALLLAFALAEMIFVPSVEMVFLSIVGKANRSVAYSIMSLSTAVGESLGTSLGILTYTKVNLLGYGNLFWLLASLCALFFAIATFFLVKLNPHLADT
jgi:MFS family permease